MTKEELSHTFAINLEKERHKLNYSQAKMAAALDMSLSTYKNLIDGNTSNGSLYTLYKIYKLTGKLSFEMIEEDIKEREIIDYYRALTEHQRNYIRAVCDVEIGLNSIKDGVVPMIIPTTNMEDGMIWDTCTYSTVNVPSHYNADCAIKVTSNHLHPAYIKDDVILIKKRPPRDGDIGVFVNLKSGRAYLRKFRQTYPCLLQPITEFGKTFEILDNNMSDWVKFGCVITRLRY